MHELALAEAVVTAALETAKKNGLTKVTRIEVCVGELQQIEPEAFRFAIEEMIEALGRLGVPIARDASSYERPASGKVASHDAHEGRKRVDGVRFRADRRRMRL